MRKITMIAIGLIASVSLFAQLSCNNYSVEFTADGNSFFFTSNRDGIQEIYKANADGSGLTRITNNAIDEYYPRLHPDGTKLIFQAGPYGPASEIYTINTDGTNLVRLTNNNRHDGCPSYHPNGQKIIFEGWDDYDYPEIFTMDADGSNRVQITNESGAFWQSYPLYNHDASKIYMSRGFNADNHIVMMDLDGSNWVDITPENEFGYSDGYFNFSPDGSKLVFYTAEWGGYGGILEIVTCNADGSDWQRLTTAQSSDEFNILPSFNRQGNMVYFSSNREDKDGYQIFRMDLDGSNIERISDCGPAAVNELVERTAELACQPNPLIDNGYIEMNFSQPDNVNVQFLDIAGSQVSVYYTVSSDGIHLKKGELASGLYFFNIHDAGRHVGFGKFVVQ